MGASTTAIDLVNSTERLAAAHCGVRDWPVDSNRAEDSSREESSAAREASYVPASELAQFNRQSAKSRLRVWSLFVLVFGTAALLVNDPVASLGVNLAALIWPGMILVGACLVVIYLPIAYRYPWLTFYLQMFIGLAALSACIHLAAIDEMAVAARLLFVLILVPPYLVSQRAGIVGTVACIAAHLLLILAEDGVSWATLASGASIGPTVSLALVAMMASAHAGYMGETTSQLRDLASHLDKSRRRLGRLIGLAKTLNESTDLQSLLDRVNGAVRREFRADWCATYRADLAGGTFQLAAASDRTSGRSAQMMVDELPVLHRLARAGVMFLDGGESRSLAVLLDVPHALGTMVMAALSRGSEMQGFLVLGYRGERPRFSEGELAQIAAVTEHATIALEKARRLDDERELSAMKSEFLSTMSHELRTPINIILGYVDILLDPDTGSMNDDQRKLFASIETQARELNDLIESVLRLGRIESGHDEIVIAPVEFDQLVTAITASVQFLPRRDGVELCWEDRDVISGTMDTDSARVALVVRNLVGNAFKFTERGSVTIRFARDGADLLLDITDTGPGIPPESLPHIFDMFRQVGREPGARAKGVGFGLYIVEQTVRRLGGSVRVTSKLGSGTTFHVRLPGFRDVAMKQSA